MFYMNCGAQLPSNAKFCLNCGAEIKIPDPNDSHSADKDLTEPVPDKEGTDQQHKDDSVRAAIAKYKEQMKFACLPVAVCSVITIFYAFLVPKYTEYRLYALMGKDAFWKDFFSMFGIFVFGAIISVICLIIAAKKFNAARGQPRISTKDLPPEVQKDLNHIGSLYAYISMAPFLGAMLIYGFRFINAIG